MVGALVAGPETAGMLGLPFEDVEFIVVAPLLVGFEGWPPSVVQPESTSVLVANNTASDIVRILITEG